MGLKVVNKIEGIDVDKTVKELDRVMKDFILRTLSIYVTHSTDPIPVWSGASRASFKKLAVQARTRIDIQPVAPIDRQGLGEATSKGVVLADKAKGEYGWEWASSLDYIPIVDDRVQFVDAGIKSVQNEKPNLPGVVLEGEK
jgi:hypothetical protein